MSSARRSGVVNNGLGSVWDVQLCIVGAWTDSTLGKNRNSCEILILHKAHRVMTWFFFMCIFIYESYTFGNNWKDHSIVKADLTGDEISAALCPVGVTVENNE